MHHSDCAEASDTADNLSHDLVHFRGRATSQMTLRTAVRIKYAMRTSNQERAMAFAD